MRAVFEKSFYERLVDFYTEQSVATGKKIVRILLDDGEWRDFLNDKDMVSKSVSYNLLCKKTKTVQQFYEITLQDKYQQLRCVTVARDNFTGDT
jgi:hypothetical protein